MNDYEKMFGEIFGENLRGKFGKDFAKIFAETKEEVINKYIKGLITKEEYIRRMKDAR